MFSNINEARAQMIHDAISLVWAYHENADEGSLDDAGEECEWGLIGLYFDSCEDERWWNREGRHVVTGAIAAGIIPGMFANDTIAKIQDSAA